MSSHQFNVAGCDTVCDLFSVPEVRLVVHSLALGQFRKGGSVLSRHHNDAFADVVFVKIAEWTALSTTPEY